MSKIGIIGDADSVLGFKVFGLDAFACRNKEEAADKLHSIVRMIMESSISLKSITKK